MLLNWVEVSLKRCEAKVTVNVKTADGLVFEPGTYKLGNVPSSTFLTEHTKGSDQTASWDANRDGRKIILELGKIPV